MSTIYDYLTHAELSFAAYATLNIGAVDTRELVKDSVGFSPTQAQNFASRWQVIDQFNDPSGLSVTLFEEIGTGKQVVAVRGTNDPNDIITDFIDIAVLGTPERQAQYEALKNQVGAWLADGVLSPGFTTTGHSLGGFLSGALLVDYPVEIGHAYLYNAPGVGGLSAGLRLLTGLETEPTLDLAKVSNLIAAAGPSLTAGLGLDWGAPVAVTIENQAPNLIANHYIKHLVDSLAVYNLFATIDTNTTLDTITSILEAMPVADNADTLEATIAAVGEIYGKDGYSKTAYSNRDELYQNLKDLEGVLSSGTVQSLASLSPSAIEFAAREETASLYAVIKLNPFAIRGVDYTSHNVDGLLDIENYSDQYLEDRSSFVYHLSHPDIANASKLDFYDRTTGVRLTPDGPMSGVGTHYVWGTEDSEPLDVEGYTGFKNHIFGMGGDDTLAGREQDDYLEGGKGHDVMDGGMGDDVFYVGGEDEAFDEFEGSFGYDKIIGSKLDDVIRVNDFTGHDIEEIDGGEGTDILAGTEGNDELDITDVKFTNLEKIETLGGDDIVQIGEFASDTSVTSIDGGAGTDTIAGTMFADTIDLTNNQVEITNFEKIDMRAGSDTLRVANLDSSSGFESIDGGGWGTDIIEGTDEANTIDLSGMTIENIDEIHGRGGDDTITATSQDDRIFGEDGNDTITGGGGADNISGGDGDDTITGGSAMDQLYGDAGSDTIRGGGHNDSIYGGEGDDTLFGEGDNDYILGDGGDDTLDGGSGNDTLNGGDGKDQMYGGAGYDTYYATSGDLISDSDGEGRVYFGGRLTGGKQTCECEDKYKGNGGYYTLSGGTLTFTRGSESVTITSFADGDLGINLEELTEEERQNFCSPLILDLNGNGTTSVSLFDTNARFDLAGDGFAERTGWTEAGDGLLALDLNQNGTIDNGTELFGNYTIKTNGNPATDGFDALSEYDSNNDQLINNKDEIYSSLKVWQDGNQDGVSQAEELQTLSEHHIEAISLNAVSANQTEARNDIKQVSTFTRQQTDQDGNVLTDGDGNPLTEEQAVRDVWFMQDLEDTTYTFEGTVSAQIAAMPELKGSGLVMNLSHAMSEDAALVTAVNELIAAGSVNMASLQSKAEELMAQWTNTDGINPNETRGVQYILNHNYSNPGVARAYTTYATARQIAVLEAFRGEPFEMKVGGEVTSDVIGTEASDIMAMRFETMRDTIIIDLLGQSLFVKSVYDAETGELDKQAFVAALNTELSNNGNPTRQQIAGNLLSVMLNRSQMSVFDYVDSAILNDSAVQSMLQGNGISLSVDANGQVSGTIKDHKYGGEGNDSLSGSQTMHGGSGNDVLTGGGGADVLYGDAGDDVLNGNVGNDILYGGDGNDTLNAGGGYGHDVLYGGKGDDTLIGNGRDSSFVYQYGDGHDVINDQGNVGSGVGKDILTLEGFDSDDVKINKDGNDMLLTMREFPTEDAAFDFGSVRIVNGFSNGKMESFRFADQTYDFDQLLSASGFFDTEYTYNLGDLETVINDIGGTDRLVFGDGITQEQLAVQAVAGSDDLVVAIKEDGKTFAELTDKIRIVNAFKEDNRVEEFVFADGSVVEFTELLKMQTVSEGNDYIRLFGEGDDIVDGLGGNDVIQTRSGQDQLAGGAGNDSLEGGSGDDLYIFNRGDGHDTILDADVAGGNGGNDTLRFGQGITSNDLIVIKQGEDIVVGLKEVGVTFDLLVDKITITGWYNADKRIESFVFADGTVMDSFDLLAKGVGTEGNDYLEGDDQDNVFFGRGGNDTLIGHDGNDILYGEQGSDTLVGNGGDDILSGGSGDDVYWFDRGNGNDVLADMESAPGTNGGLDTVIFGTGITIDDLDVHKEGNDIVLGLKEAGKSFSELSDTLRIHNWYKTNERVESFTFADGSVISAGELIRFIGTSGDDVVYGIETGSTFEDTVGNDTYHGVAGNDVYHFAPGNGNDVVIDTAGTDKIVFADGISSADLNVTWVQGTADIVITFKNNNTDEITLKGWYDSARRIETIEFADGTVWDASTVVGVIGTDGEDVYNGLAEADNIIDGLGGDDIIGGGVGNDTINGSAGDDGLSGLAGDDTLAGGIGDDLLWGDGGNDTYIFNRGDGHDQLLDSIRYGNAGNDILAFGAGISAADLVFRVDPENDDLVIGIGTASSGEPFESLADVVTIKDWFKADNRIETISFADGSSLDVAGIMASMHTDGNDVLKALAEGGPLAGGGGDDTIYGNVGIDVLDGEAGNDHLYGGQGADRLTGGTGADTLEGGGGDDTYVFNRGDGADTVLDARTTTVYRYGRVNNGRFFDYIPYEELADAGNDTFIFGPGITASDLVVRPSGDDVIIGIVEAGKTFEALSDKITIRNFYKAETAIEKFVFADGTTLSPQGIIDLMFTEGNDTVVFGNDADQIVNARGGNDTVITGGGNDIINGGAGSDYLEGGRGNDTYVFTPGDGRDQILDYGNSDWWQTSAGNDTIRLTGGITSDDVEVSWGGKLSGYYRNGQFLGESWSNGAVYEDHGSDLIISLKEPGVALADRADRIVIQDWFKQESRIENVVFDDGTAWDAQAILDASFTEGADYVDFSNADAGLTINSKGGDDEIIASNFSDTVNGGSGNDTLTGGAGGDYINGGTGDDTIIGDELWFDGESSVAGADTLNGDAGNDTLHGGGGTDTLAGGLDNDTLYGGSGDDTYLFNQGDGTDEIYDEAGFNDWEDQIDRFGHDNWVEVRREPDAGNDTLLFGEGVTAADVVFVWGNAKDANGSSLFNDLNLGSDDLVVALKNPANPDATIDQLTDRIVIRDWFHRAEPFDDSGYSYYDGYSGYGGTCAVPSTDYVNKIENFKFADGQVLNGHTLIAAMQSDRDDRIEAVIGQDSLIYGLAGNDLLKGDTGSDFLFGGEGDDELSAGYGVNYVDGGVGDDTYVITSENTPPWDGRTSQDTITDSSGVDKLLFMNDIAREDIIFTKEGNDLLITYGLELQHSVRIQNNVVESFEMSDGSFISREEVEAALSEMASLAGTSVEMLTASEVFNDIDLKTVIYNTWTDNFVEHDGSGNWRNEFTGNSDNEIVTGSYGYDNLLGHSGNDTLQGSEGDDLLNAGNGNDKYIFNRGDHNDIILDAENLQIEQGYGGYGGGEGYYYYGNSYDGYGGGTQCTWEFLANDAPSNDTLLLKDNINLADLEAYWATDYDDWQNRNVNDLQIRINPTGGADWNDRATNVTNIVDYYSQRGLYDWVYDSSTRSWNQIAHELTAADLEGYSDKGLKQLAYQIDYGNDWIRYSSDYSDVNYFLEYASEQTAYFQEYRGDADTITIQQYYDQRYTIENITITNQGQEYTLTNNDIMDLMSTSNAEMIRGVDWADNTINAKAGDDAVVGGELNDTIAGEAGNDLLNGRTGDDTYLFNLGDGRDTLVDGAYDFDYLVEEARYWYGGRGFDGGEGWFWDSGSGSQAGQTPGAGDAGGYDKVVFGDGITIQNVGFSQLYYDQGLYVGYGNLVTATDENSDWMTYDIGNAGHFNFSQGYQSSGYQLTNLVYENDIYLQNQFETDFMVEEFVMGDGSWITNTEIEDGLWESSDYIDDNAEYLQSIEDSGRDARGYVDQIMLNKWHRVDKIVDGTDAADLLASGDGNDSIAAGAGNDVIAGGFGSDVIDGGVGDDTYLYNRWDGADTIIDAAGYDTLSFGNGLLLTDLVATLDYTTGNLTLGVIDEVEMLRAASNGTVYDPDPQSLTQQITLTNWHGVGDRVESFTFADGTVMSAMELYNHFFTSESADNILGIEGDNVIDAKGGNDIISLGDGSHIIDAGDGDDVVTTGAGDDVIYSGLGADTVFAGLGDDIINSMGDNNQLSGGAGNDTLLGGAGDDFFHFGVGDGSDTIYDAGGIDTLVLNGSSIIDNTLVTLEGNDVIVTLADGSTTFIKDWAIPENKIENIRFGDGTVLAMQDALAMRTRDYEVELLEDNSVGGFIELTNPGTGVKYSIEQVAANGSFTIDASGNWQYIPNQDYNGSDVAVVTITNDQGHTATSIIDLTIDPVNDLPAIDPIATQVLQDIRELAGNLGATDVDGDTLAYSVSTQATNGTVSVDAEGNWQYQANDGFMGTDSAEIAIDDGNGGVVTTTIDFDVRVSPPTVPDLSLSMLEDGSLANQLTVDNPVGGGLRYEMAEGSANGAFALNPDGSFTYDPAADYNGFDSVKVTVTNDYGMSTTAIIDLDIIPVNDAPVAPASESINVLGIPTVSGRFNATDVDGDVLSYSASTGPMHGVLTLNEDGFWIYSPEDGYFGEDVAEVTVDDGNGGVVTTQLHFTVNVYLGGDVILPPDTVPGILLKDISKDDLQLTRQGDDLYITVKGKGSITLTRYYLAPENGVDYLETIEGPLHLAKDSITELTSEGHGDHDDDDDGHGNEDHGDDHGRDDDDDDDDDNCRDDDKHDRDQGRKLIFGTERHDSISGDKLNDVIFGSDAKDNISGKQGDDTLVGGNGDDKLFGNEGDDTLYGDMGNDHLQGDHGNDAMIGGAGKDYLHGGSGNDWLFGDDGNDKLYGDEGNDQINGGTGNDYLKGGLGSDTYILNKGDGFDTIKEEPSGRQKHDDDDDDHGRSKCNTKVQDIDIIKFGEGINREDVAFLMKKDSLYLQYGDADLVKIKDQGDDKGVIERFELADGSYLSDGDINMIVQQMSAFAVNEGICLNSTNTVRKNDELMNMISTAWRMD